ncbi:hypothetical protein B0T17DRAFT_504947 [Bombardia bombarda]|uniref:Uncharacterized protein n=1 Tax=Bombardia bombarda TaxID=252184 RepID=A0AA40C7X3_9PEZI|nr:hypothetical protein B0T17DRAFT_504947 [Bombardia bombarda]
MANPPCFDYIWPCKNFDTWFMNYEDHYLESLPQGTIKSVDITNDHQGYITYRQCCECGEFSPVHKEFSKCPNPDCTHPFVDEENENFRRECPDCIAVGWNGQGLANLPTKDNMTALVTRAGKICEPYQEIPVYWRCEDARCLTTNIFKPDAEDKHHLPFLVPHYKPRLSIPCGNSKHCKASFRKNCIVFNSHRVCLGRWDGSEVAYGGPWWQHMVWHSQECPKGCTHDNEKCPAEKCAPCNKYGYPRSFIPAIAQKGGSTRPHKPLPLLPMDYQVARHTSRQPRSTKHDPSEFPSSSTSPNTYPPDSPGRSYPPRTSQTRSHRQHRNTLTTSAYDSSSFNYDSPFYDYDRSPPNYDRSPPNYDRSPPNYDSSSSNDDSDPRLGNLASGYRYADNNDSQESHNSRATERRGRRQHRETDFDDDIPYQTQASRRSRYPPRANTYYSSGRASSRYCATTAGPEQCGRWVDLGGRLVYYDDAFSEDDQQSYQRRPLSESPIYLEPSHYYPVPAPFVYGATFPIPTVGVQINNSNTLGRCSRRRSRRCSCR